MRKKAGSFVMWSAAAALTLGAVGCSEAEKKTEPTSPTSTAPAPTPEHPTSEHPTSEHPTSEHPK
jgi:hypothetical protein